MLKFHQNHFVCELWSDLEAVDRIEVEILV